MLSVALPLQHLLHTSSPDTLALPAALAALVWRGAGEAARLPSAAVQPCGYDALNALLPGGGWPLGVVTELLLDEPASCEWRLLGPALRQVAQREATAFLIAPPQPPHDLARMLGKHLVWVPAHTPSQALWACQQVIQSGVAGAVLAWLPQVTAAALRRLQACAQSATQHGAASGNTLVFVMRPSAAAQASSPAPLRVAVALGEPASLKVQIVKRRGPPHEGEIELTALPDGLSVALAGKHWARRRGKTPQAMPTAAPTTSPAWASGPPSTSSSPEVPHAALAGAARPLARAY